MSIDKDKLKDGLKTAFNTGISFAKEAAPYVRDGFELAGEVANYLMGKGSPATNNNNATNTDYKPNNQAQQYQMQLNNLQKPTQQNSQWQQQLNETMDAILNKEKFSYDVNADALYQQYKDQYMLSGLLAQQEAVGQASAMTGGYGNSYAQSVGQQQFQGHMQQLTDKIPELYQLALNAHNQEAADLYNRYNMLADADAQEYARYRDQIADYYADRDYLSNQYYNERNFDYNKYVDDRNYQYQIDRDKVADEQWQKQYNRDVLESDRQFGYQISRDLVSDARYNNEWLYKLSRDAVDDKRYDTEWQHQLDREAVSDKRYDTEWQYQLDRDAVSDKRYDTDWQYQLDRDAVADKRYDTEWQYQLDRDKISDSQWLKSFEEGIRQYNASLAEDKRQDNLNYELQKKKLSSSGGSGGSGGSGSKTTNKTQKSENKNETNDSPVKKDESSAPTYLSLKGELAVLAEKGYTLNQLRDYVNKLNNKGAIKNTLDYRRLYDYCYEIATPSGGGGGKF